MLNIAITGGIGSGKTTVTDYLISKGYKVVDADEMARNITSKGGKAIPFIEEKFGKSFIAADGSMDRAKMRDLVFNNPEAKKLLESGTTKVVIDDIKSIIKESSNKGESAIFFSIPQLFENRFHIDFDQVWSVVADKDIKKQRIKSRDNIPDSIIDLIISSQAEEKIFLENSDEIIYNNESVEKLYDNIDSLLKKYSL